jgi:hypothetical protein
MARKTTLPDVLGPLIAQEIASIGAIDAAMPHERHPGYVVLLRTAKMGKQANAEQLSSMTRMEGLAQAPKASAIEPLLKLQSAAMSRLGTTPLLLAMRIAETAIVAMYEARLGSFQGVFERGFERCWRRARKHLTVVAAHLGELTPLPRSHYFAHEERRVCFRCLFDRPGNLPPLERSDPHPYTYICAACHEDALGDFPPDILESAPRWSDREREARVIEHALSRPSRLKAENGVLNKLAGLAPELPPPPLPYKNAIDAAPKKTTKQRDSISVMHVEEMAPEERGYVERLFDYRTVRVRW